MAIRVDYLLREAAVNLKRNMLLTFAGIITVTISLGILGSILCFRAGVDNAFRRFKGDVEFIVYMKPDATGDQIKRVGEELKASPQVAKVDFVDQDETFKEFQDLFRDNDDITEGITKADLPTSYRVKPKNPQASVVDDLGKSFEAKSGVYQVEFAADIVKKQEVTYRRLTSWFLVVAVILLVASALLIVFMIQTAVFARRREIEVQRLVGATNWFIRLPFVLEGVVYGLVGGVMAAAAVSGMTWAWNTQILANDPRGIFSTIRWGSPFGGTVVKFEIGLLIIGAVVGGLGSLIAVARYLRA